MLVAPGSANPRNVRGQTVCAGKDKDGNSIQLSADL